MTIRQHEEAKYLDMLAKQKLRKLYKKYIRQERKIVQECDRTLKFYRASSHHKLCKDARYGRTVALAQIKLLEWCIQEHCGENS